MQASVRTGNATTEALARDLGVFVSRLLASTQHDIFSAIEKIGLSITQVKCLQILYDAEGPQSLGAVSDSLGLSLPAISRAVDALVQRGEVKREEDPRDRRSKLVTVTARGRATADRLLALRMAGIRSFVEELEPDEQQALASALSPVVTRMNP